MKRSLTILLFVLSVSYTKAQKNVFSRVIVDSTAMENMGIQGTSFTPTYDNGYIITGYSYISGLVVKIDSSGKLLWNKTINLGNNLTFYDVVSTFDSCFMLVGNVTSNITGFSDAICTKMNNNGDTVWTKEIHLPNKSTVAYSIKQTLDSGYILSGLTTDNLFSALLDKSGNLQWSKFIKINKSIYYRNVSVRQCADSGYLIIGTGQPVTGVNSFVFLIKLLPNGSISWAKKYLAINKYCTGYDLINLNDGYLCYMKLNNSLVLLKIDNSGKALWNKSYDVYGYGGGNLVPPNIQLTSDSGFIFFDSDCSVGTLLYRVDSAGEFLCGNAFHLIAFKLLETPDKGFFIAGNGPLCGMKTGIREIGIIKIDSIGSNDLRSCYTSLQNKYVVNTIVDSTIIFTDSSSGSEVPCNLVISNMKLSIHDGCVKVTPSVYETTVESDIRLFPNPSSGIFTFESKEIKQYQISIYNILGETIYRATLTGISHQIDLTSESNGMYYYRIESSDKNFASGKLLKIE